MTDFRAFLTSLGLVPETVVADGEWHRCRTRSHPHRRNGAYKLLPGGALGFGRDFARHEAPVLWRAGEAPAGAEPAVEAKELGRWLARNRRRAAEATERAREFYRRARPLRGGHDYLRAHGLDMTGCHGLRVDAEGWLVVPALRRGEIVSVQRISPEGRKLYWKHAPIAGASYPLERRGATVSVLCEGLATGLALYAAVPLSRVVVAFHASNMPEVLDAVGSGLCVVAADNDAATERRTGQNPGVEYARKAAGLLGCGVAVPHCTSGTDFCDLRNERTSERLARRGRYEREDRIRRAVDAELAAEVMRQARYRAGVREAG